MEQRIGRRRRVAAIAGCVLACAAAGAGAEPVVDQALGDPDNGNRIVGHERDVAQTFTAGVGGVITRVDVKISIPTTAPVPYDLVVDLRPTTELGMPVEDDDAALDRRVVPASAFPTFLDPLDFTAIEGLAVPVEPGDLLGLVLRAPSSPEGVAPYDWRAGAAGDPYESGTPACRGAAIVSCATGWRTIGGDQQFRTWVDPALRVEASVGEPGNGLRIVGDARELAQTFTIEHTGTLRWIDLQLRRPTTFEDPYELVVDVRPTSAGGAPLEDDGAALATRTFASGQVPTFLAPRTATRVDDLAIPVAAGDVLAVVLRSPSAPENVAPYDWFAGPAGDAYAGGAAYCRGAAIEQCASGWSELAGDMQMRAVVEVPEPGGAAPACAALAALGAVARRYARVSKKST
ncbi:MAG: hypothetical protein DCC71_17140 [Proteobacteria bacterium]|nr:MAG: hypothetical protein DCC71_17140 [Pseudomonadota bacterium]